MNLIKNTLYLTFAVYLFSGCIEQPEQFDYWAQFGKDVKIIRKYIKDNNLQVDSTASGLFFKIHAAGDQQNKVVSDARIKFNYRGKLIDGTTFLDTFEKDAPVSLRLNNTAALLRCLSEGVRMLGNGGRITLYSPSLLAYGEFGNPPFVAPHTVVVFDVTIVDVLPVENNN